MNVAELFFTQPELAKAAHECLEKFFHQKLNTKVGLSKPEVVSSSSLNVKTLALLRVNTPNYTGVMTIGSTSPNFQEYFNEVVANSWKEVSSMANKAPELQLLSSIYPALEPHIKAQKIDVDPKSLICLNAKAAGNWATISTNKVLRFTMVISGQQMNLEIPFIDEAMRKSIVVNSYGFGEDEKILVVDDSATTRKLSRHHLNSVGYIFVEECVDGKAALESLQADPSKFSLVIADWHMPNLTGIELLKSVRGNPKMAGLPVILVTGERNKEEVTKAVQEKVTAYVVKPFEAETLFKAMKVAKSKEKKAA